MATKLPTLDEIHAEIVQLRKRHGLPSDDQTFVFWYCSVALTGSEDRARGALIGGAGDVNADALYVDDDSQTVFLIQAKYRTNEKAAENRNDLIAFRSLGRLLGSRDRGQKQEFSRLLGNADALVVKRLMEARERVLRRGYYLSLRFVSTGHVSAGLFEEFERTEEDLEMIIQDGLRIRRLYREYLDGAAPPVAAINLALDLKDTVRRYDKRNGIESWVVTVGAPEIARLYRRTGSRIFARNIRGFLGSSEINKGMRDTLASDPEKFWYYNNGITIVCDKATHIREGGEDKLKIESPQIINGQQTTRVLAENPSGHASVLVRVTAFPRDTPEGQEVFGQLIENVVAATNRQNPIFASDLRSNDGEQVRIERELLKRGYLYMRKRQVGREARANAPQKTWWTIRKDQIAQAVGACFLDPYEVRMGKENLFETDNYSRVFGARPIATYLACSWLRSAVRRQSHGKPQRAYSSWLVLHRVWADIAARFPGGKQHEDFVWYIERESWESPGMRALGRAIDALFKDALRFFKKNRGKGEEAADISTFFKRKGLPSEFESFWNRPSNTSRAPYRRSIEQFVTAVHVRLEEQAV